MIEESRTTPGVPDSPPPPPDPYRLLVEGATDYAMLLLDRTGVIVGWNAGAIQIFGYKRHEAIGQSATLIFTEEDQAAGIPNRELARAFANGRAADFRWHRKKDGSLFWADGIMQRLDDEAGVNQGFAKILRDATAQKRAENILQASEDQFQTLFQSMAQGALLYDSATRRLVGANTAAETMLGQTLAEMQSHEITDTRWQPLREDGTPLPTDEYPSARALATGQASVGQVIGVYNPRLQAYRWLRVSSVPQFRAGETTPFRAYSLFEDVTEQREQEQERLRLYAETAARAERESLINAIGQAVRNPHLTPDDVQRRAATLLGQALGLDRCYFSVFDGTRSILHIGDDWFRPGLRSIAGDYSGEKYAHMSQDIYEQGSARAVFRDLREAPFEHDIHDRFARLGFRSLVGVALRERGDGRIMASMGAVMVDTPRDWTDDEIELMEAAATLVWSALETFWVQQRDRNIASQLQEALIPPYPPALPGMALAAHYQPALDEAGVGGDFYDVFALEKGCTALVVADLSGKGLAAASQVATVRNMLRYAVYTGRTLAEAVTTLNNVLAEQDLLTGFATVFLGAYDHGFRTLTYVNCGQEPGLLGRCATGTIEELAPTGPVLGGFSTGAFTESIITLAPGDLLAFFTDGLTEVGPDRRVLLEIEGVRKLFQECCDTGMARDGRPPTPELVVRYLIDGIDAYARGGRRDDVALLVGGVHPF
jgi:PAS domain S-box-containing protein